MEKFINAASIVIGMVGGVFANIFGAWDALLYVLVSFMAIDYITGVIKGIYQKQLSSNIGFRGLLKKISVLSVAAVANLVQILIGDDLAVREIVLVFFIANEGISILENAAVLYPNIPQQLKDILLQLRENNEGK